MSQTTNVNFSNPEEVFQFADDSWHAGFYDDAKKYYLQSADLYEKNSDNHGQASSLMRLAELMISLDEYEQALPKLQHAFNLVKNADEEQLLAGDILIKTAKAYGAQNMEQEAFATIAQAQDVLENARYLDMLGDAFDYQAYLYLMQNNEGEALKAYMKAAKLYESERISLKEASVLRAIARILMKQRQYDEAHDVLEKCRNLYRENGDLLGEASALSAIGSLRYIIKDIQNARKALMKAVYLYSKVEYHFAEAEALLYLARVEAYNKEQGDFERAKAHYKKSIRLFDFLENDMMKNMVLEEYHNFLNRVCC